MSFATGNMGRGEPTAELTRNELESLGWSAVSCRADAES